MTSSVCSARGESLLTTDTPDVAEFTPFKFLASTTVSITKVFVVLVSSLCLQSSKAVRRFAEEDPPNFGLSSGLSVTKMFVMGEVSKYLRVKLTVDFSLAFAMRFTMPPHVSRP